MLSSTAVKGSVARSELLFNSSKVTKSLFSPLPPDTRLASFGKIFLEIIYIYNLIRIMQSHLKPNTVLDSQTGYLRNHWKYWDTPTTGEVERGGFSHPRNLLSRRDCWLWGVLSKYATTVLVLCDSAQDHIDTIWGEDYLNFGLFTVCFFLLDSMGVDVVTSFAAVAANIDNTGPGWVQLDLPVTALWPRWQVGSWQIAWFQGVWRYKFC